MMTMMMRCPFGRRRAGLVLFTHLLLLGLLPVAEVLHQHGHPSGVELHNAGECEHESHQDKCSLLRVGSVPALPTPPARPAAADVLIATPFAVAPAAALPRAPPSPALPRAPPAG